MTTTTTAPDHAWAWDAAACAHSRALQAWATGDHHRAIRELEGEMALDYLFDHSLLIGEACRLLIH